MIINLVLTVIEWIIDLILDLIDVIEIPAAVVSVFGEFVAAVIAGIEIVAAYTHFEYLCVLLGIIIAINAIMLVYKIIRWLIRKIPFINIS